MKKILCFMLSLGFLLILSPAVQAASCEIRDNANLLSSSERNALCDKAKQIADEHKIAVVILTVDSLQGDETWEVCNDHFYNGGYGEDGILLLISMEWRDWEIATYGSVVQQISDSRTENLFDAMADDLAEDSFYDGFSVYLTELETALSEKSYVQNTGLQLTVSLGIGAVAAFITILVMRSKMNTVRPQCGAKNYMQQDSYNLTFHRDIYLYSNTTRVRRTQNTGSGGSGGSRGGSRGKF